MRHILRNGRLTHLTIRDVQLASVDSLFVLCYSTHKAHEPLERYLLRLIRANGMRVPVLVHFPVRSLLDLVVWFLAAHRKDGGVSETPAGLVGGATSAVQGARAK